MFVKGVAVVGFTFEMVSATTGDALTGLTVAAKINKDGAGQNPCTNAVVETAGGEYKIDLTIAEMNATLIGLLFTATGAIPVHFTIPTVAMNLDANTGTPITAGAGTAQLNVASGKAPATLASTDVTGNLAADLQTIKTQAVTCAAGVTVLASVGTASVSTAQTGDNFARIGVAGAGLTALGDARLANLDVAVSSRSTYAGGNVTVGGYAAGQDPATLVLDVAAAGHNTAGTIGAKVNAAGSVGDPWSAAEPGSYASGTFGYLVSHALVTPTAPVTITQDYLETGRLIVENPPGTPIQGATVTAYLAADYAVSGPSAVAVDTTTTDAAGGWTLSLAPAHYTLVFTYGAQQSRSTFYVR